MRSRHLVEMVIVFAVVLTLALYLRKGGDPQVAQQCQPYRCADGTTIPACTDDGHIINYFAAPCLTHGGEVETK